MSFARPLTSAELTLLRDNDDYRAQVNLIHVPQTVVFVAEVVSAATYTVYQQIVFDTVTTGAYTDIKPGMTVYVSRAGDTRAAVLETYARKTPTASTLYIGESSAILIPGDIITVVDDYCLREKLGLVASNGTIYVDGDVTFQKPAAVFGGLQSVYVDPRASGDGTFTFSPLIYLMGYQATLSSIAWDVDDGTITVGSTSTLQIIATFPQGQRWVRLTATDSNGVSNYFVFLVQVGVSNTIENIDTPAINGSTDNGYTLSLSTWDFQGTNLLRTLPNNTLIILYTAETFGDGSTSAIVTNIDFIGRTVNEQSRTMGDLLHGNLQTGGFEVQGFAAQMNRQSSPQVSITHSTAPAVWGQINRPTPPRMIAHLATRFSTLSNLCSLMFEVPFVMRATTVNADATVTVASTRYLSAGMGVSGTGIPASTTILSITNDTTFELSANATTGASNNLTFSPVYDDHRFITQSMTVTDTSAGSAYNKIAGAINAVVCHAASGEIAIRRHAFYRATADKNALATIAELTDVDRLEYTLLIEYPDKVGQAFTGAEVFNTSTLKTLYVTGSAPPQARGNGEGQASLDGMILAADATAAAIVQEHNQRTAAFYAASQPITKMEVILYDAWRGIFIPNPFQWITQTIASTDNNSGRAYTTGTRWIVDSVTSGLNIETGQVEFRLTLLQEPVTGTSQVSSAIAPEVTISPYPNLPAINPFPAFDLNGLINYPVNDPDDADLQPVDSYSAYQTQTGYPPESRAADSFPPPNCRNYNILINDSTGVTTPALTNGATYTVRAAGSGQIGDTSASYNDPLTAAMGALTHLPSVSYPFGLPGNFTGTSAGEYITTGGFGGGGSLHGTLQSGVNFDVTAIIDLGVERDIVQVTWRGKRAGVTAAYEAIGFLDNSGTVITSHDMGTTDPDYGLRTYATPIAGCRYICIGVDYNNGDAWLDDITVDYTQTTHADAFYTFDPTNPGAGTLFTGHGLEFDGASPTTIPSYNPSHVYETTITGDGTTTVIKFDDSNYADNAPATISVRLCGNGL